MAKVEAAAGSWIKWSWERRDRRGPTLRSSLATGALVWRRRKWCWTVVTTTGNRRESVNCRWLDRNEDDGQIVRELVPFSDGQRLYSESGETWVWLQHLTWTSLSTLVFVSLRVSDVDYHIAVKTGSIPGSSSDSNVFVKLYGEKCDTSTMMLLVSANNLGNYFETARVDIFIVETVDIGQVTQGGNNIWSG